MNVDNFCILHKSKPIRVDQEEIKEYRGDHPRFWLSDTDLWQWISQRLCAKFHFLFSNAYLHGQVLPSHIDEPHKALSTLARWNITGKRAHIQVHSGYATGVTYYHFALNFRVCDCCAQELYNLSKASRSEYEVDVSNTTLQEIVARKLICNEVAKLRYRGDDPISVNEIDSAKKFVLHYEYF